MLSSFSRLPDPRQAQGKQYGMEEVMLGGLSLFFFKEGSRNQLNNHRSDGNFSDHYRSLFDMRLPHQDSIKEVLCELPDAELEQVKMNLMSDLFEQKWLREYRLLDKYYLVAVDAMGIVPSVFLPMDCILMKTHSKSVRTRAGNSFSYFRTIR